MYEDILLLDQRQGFYQKFLEEDQQQKMEGFKEFDLDLRFMMMFKWKTIQVSHIRKHKE